MSHADHILDSFRALDAFLQTKGFPATSPWWHETIERFYRSRRKQLVARVGRRGGKSSTMCRLAVCEALYGEHAIPPSDTGVVAIVSASKDDANERLATIRSILVALGYSAVRRGTKPGPLNFIESAEEILLPHRRVAFRVYAASVRGVSGFTSIFILLDEVSKWRDEKTGTNPAREVLRSIRPTMKTQKNARRVLISSPMGLLDAHADAFAKGDTAKQLTAYAPTWTANPTITEQECRDEADDDLEFEREYKAIPQAEDELSAFDGDLVRLAIREARPVADEDLRRYPLLTAWDVPPDDRHRYVATIDPATRGNAWTLIVATLSDNFVRRIVLAREWRGTKKKPLVPGEVFKEIRVLIAPYRLRVLYSDQFSEDSLREIARQHDLYLLVDPPWSPATKADAYEMTRTLLQERRLDLPPDPQISTDMLGVRQRLTRNGLVYDLARNGPRHSDYAPAIAMSVMLARVPPTPLPQQQTDAEKAEAQKVAFLRGREAERRRRDRRERFGRHSQRLGIR